MAETPFLWGRGGRKLTPDQIEKERQTAALLAKGAMDYSPVAHWSQGLNRVAQGLLAGIDYRMADKAEAENAEVNKGIIANLLAGGSSATSPASSSAIPMSGATGEIAATAPGSAIAPSGILPSSFLSAVDSSEGGGAYDTLYGNAQRNKFAGTDVSSMPIRDVIAFTDPSGAYAQAVKSQIGRVATPVGRHQIVGTTLRNAVSDLGLDPNAPFDAATQDRIALHLAKNRVASADTMGGKIAALRSEWHGFRNVPDEQMRQIVADIEQAPVNVAPVAPQTATDAIEAVAPLQPTPEAAISYAGQERAAPVSLSEEVAAYEQTPEYAAVFPGRQQPAAAAQPVQVAGGGDRVPMAPASTGINPAIIEALTNPQASPQTQRLAGILLQQDQSRQNAALDEQNWRARQAYEQELLASDPLRKLQIQKAQQELDRGQPLINAGDGAIYDPNTGQWLNVPGGSKKAPQVVELFDEATGQPYKATWNAETGQYERVGGVKARSGMQLTTNPDGTVTLTEGAIGGLPKLTEAEGRNSGFYGRGVESQKILNSLEGEGTSLFNKVAGGLPVVGNYLTGQDAQKYGQAKRDFINAVLRRESGAVISPEEFANADQQYFPQPGDGPEVIEQKRQNRETTIQGLKISAGQGAAFAVPSQQGAPERKRLKFNPATGELE